MIILYHLAQGSAWWPTSELQRVSRFTRLSLEQKRHMKLLAKLRLQIVLREDTDPNSAQFVRYGREAKQALKLLDRSCSASGRTGGLRPWTHPSISDIPLYPYSCMAPVGRIHLAPVVTIRHWPARIQALPGCQPFVPGRPDRNLKIKGKA